MQVVIDLIKYITVRVIIKNKKNLHILYAAGIILTIIILKEVYV
jgi:hypothetical protein